jgi:hypothetical protein
MGFSRGVRVRIARTAVRLNNLARRPDESRLSLMLAARELGRGFAADHNSRIRRIEKPFRWFRGRA